LLERRFAFHEKGLVDDASGKYLYMSKPVKASICTDCSKALGKNPIQTQTQQSIHPSTRMIDDEAEADEEEEEEHNEEEREQNDAEEQEEKRQGNPRRKVSRFLRDIDFGKVPSSLPRLNTLERLVLQRVVVFHTTYQITAHGARALKGTTIAFPCKQDTFAKMPLQQSGRELARFVKVVVVAMPGLEGLVQRLFREERLLLDVHRIRAWALFLVQHHPSYKEFAEAPGFIERMVQRAHELQTKLAEDVTIVRILCCTSRC
jgi:hypothetical protein